MNHHSDPLIEDQLIEKISIERAMGENTAAERAIPPRPIVSDPDVESLPGAPRGSSVLLSRDGRRPGRRRPDAVARDAVPRELSARDGVLARASSGSGPHCRRSDRAADRDRTSDRALRESLITELVRAPVLPAPLASSPSASMTTATVTALSDRVVFNDEKLARKYASEPIPISTLYEAYFDGAIDIPGDVVAFLRSRHSFVKHTITRQHLQWAVTNFVPEMVAHSREADARAARELFDDHGDEFFRAFLGDRLAFSCAHFDVPSDTLDMASEQMSSRICDKLGLRASHRVLDVGCGWGSFLSHVAASRGAEGVGATLSRTQEAHANRRFAELGVEHQAHAIVADYRDLPAEKFDRVVCIEAVERVGVKNLKAFFEKLVEHVKDDGLLFLQWTVCAGSSDPKI
jgi:protein-L-isoaspartate O-methyltransferase